LRIDYHETWTAEISCQCSNVVLIGTAILTNPSYSADKTCDCIDLADASSSQFGDVLVASCIENHTVWIIELSKGGENAILIETSGEFSSGDSGDVIRKQR
jgi:hypothetical protein